MEALTRGELAEQGRVNSETIRYYERRGLLPKPPRTPSGYRTFSSEAVRRVRFIKRAQGLGFSLKEIKGLLALRVDSRSSCGDVRRRAEAKIADIDQKLRALRAMKRALVRLTAACVGRGPVSACPILESLDAEDGVMTLKVELVYDQDCPNVVEARHNLLRAFAEARTPARWTEWEQSRPETPARLRGFGSPTVLVEGKDVAGAQPVEGLAACRLYDAAEGRRGVPPVGLIARALSHAKARTAPKSQNCIGRRRASFALTLEGLMPHGCTEKDFTRRSIAWLLWGLPAAALILGSLVAPVPRMLLWTPAFAVAGVACVINAAQCGRLHCYITGPLHLLAAVATVLAGTDLVPLRSRWIGVAVVGGTILAHVPEWIGGRYVSRA